MIFNRALTDTQIGRNILAGMPGKDQIEHLPLARGEIRKMALGYFMFGVIAFDDMRLTESAIDTDEQCFATDRLFYEVRCAGAHGPNCDRDVAVAGEHRRQPSLPV